MKRRGFLYTLLLPFLPTPQLPMEQPLSLNIKKLWITAPSRRMKIQWSGTISNYRGETKFYTHID